MANINTITLAVTAAFNATVRMDKDSRVGTPLYELVESVKASTYIFGVTSKEDVSVVKSMIWSLRQKLVSLHDCSDKSPQDAPRSGSQEYDGVRAAMLDSVFAKARAEAVAHTMHQVAVLERHYETLAERIRLELVEASKSTEDGGRIRFGTHQVWVRPLMSWDDWLLSELSNVPVDSRRHRQLTKARDEVVFPQISAQEANELFRKCITEQRLDAIAANEQQRIIDNMAVVGELLIAHDATMAILNQQMKLANRVVDSDRRKGELSYIMSRMAQEGAAHREAINRPLWILGKQFEGWSLLCHAGPFTELIDTPQWCAEKAKIQAERIRAQAAEAQAETTVMEIEAEMSLFKARQAQAAMQRALVAQQAELLGSISPAKAKKAK